jgi:hypothetical protein
MLSPFRRRASWSGNPLFGPCEKDFARKREARQSAKLRRAMKITDLLAIIASIGGLAQFVYFMRWVYRRIRNEEVMRLFVEDMATSHLPHVYDLLDKLCEKQGISRGSAPQINWLDLSGHSRKGNASWE